MSDRELLEKAAKAVGWRVSRAADYYEGGEGAVMLYGVQEPWNPLDDDGDALRLAVQLCMSVLIGDGGTVSACIDGEERSIKVVERYTPDPCAATRRAIVRAAAAMA